MKSLLCLSTAIGLCFAYGSYGSEAFASPAHTSLSPANLSSALVSPGTAYLADSPYQARRALSGVQAPAPVNAPLYAVAAPQPSPRPVQVAALDMPLPPLDAAPMVPRDTIGTPHQLVPVLPKPSFTPARPLYPQQAVGDPQARPARPAPAAAPAQQPATGAAAPLVLPLPADSATPSPAADSPPAPAMAAPAASPSAPAAPAILPLPKAEGAAPVFKPYATIETQQNMPLQPAAQSATPSHPAPSPAPSASDAPATMTPQPAADPAADPSVPQPLILPLPEARRTTAPAPKPQEKAEKPSQPAAKLSTLSPESQRILSGLPSGIDAPRTERGSKSTLKRYDPEIEGILEAPSADENDGEEVEASESMGAKISIRRSRLNAEKELERAYHALMDGDMGGAIETYKGILRAYPSNQHALFGLATCFHRSGDNDLARPLYGKLLAINPDHRDALNNFLVLVSEESPEEALEHMKALERRNPDFSPIPAQMAIIYGKMGNGEMARKKMAQAIRLSPDNMAYKYNLAILLDKQGHYEEAAALYRTLISASQKGAAIPADIGEIEHRLVYIDQIRAN